MCLLIALGKNLEVSSASEHRGEMSVSTSRLIFFFSVSAEFFSGTPPIAKAPGQIMKTLCIKSRWK